MTLTLASETPRSKVPNGTKTNSLHALWRAELADLDNAERRMRHDYVMLAARNIAQIEDLEREINAAGRRKKREQIKIIARRATLEKLLSTPRSEFPVPRSNGGGGVNREQKSPAPLSHDH